jgi:hypothetical protein
MTTYQGYEAIVSVFDVSNKAKDAQQIYSPIGISGYKEYDTDTFLTDSVVDFSKDIAHLVLENETTDTDKSLIKIDLASLTITKTPVVDTDSIRLCASSDKACRVDSVGNVYDLYTGELFTTIGSINKQHISTSMDELINGIVYLSDDGSTIISQGSTYEVYPLASGITLGSGEVFGLSGDTVIYSATYFSPTRRKLFVIHV